MFNKPFYTTILISTYDNVEHIEECLDSIENQTFYRNEKNKFQVLVGVDGCEKTWDKLLEIEDKYRNLDMCYMEKNMGAYVALNTLIPHIEYGNVVVFGSDDIMMPNAIEVLSKTDRSYDIVKFRYKVFLGDVSNITEVSSATAAGAIMVRKRVFDICGGYHHNRFSSDAELLTRVGSFTKTLQIPDHIFYYRAHDKSLTTTVNKSERLAFDNMVRSTRYTKDNVKIIPVVNEISEW